MNVIESQQYKILIGEVLGSLYDDLELELSMGTKLFVLLDENTHLHCYDRIIRQVPALSSAEVLEVAPGEASKSIAIAEQLWSVLLSYGADRKALLINIGGGMISDLGGFIASTYKRGIRFINIPTSLLAMVDASVGGKTGINLGGDKNQVGTFAFPQKVYIYPEFLDTLPERERMAGMAEVMKHALIADDEFFSDLLKDQFSMDHLISRSVAIKNTIVAKDPKEASERKILNFGHTIGHAIESFLLGNGADILHGEAVWYGMIAEMALSQLRFGGDYSLVHPFLQKYAPKINLSFTYEMLEPYLFRDKKNEGEQINFSLISSPGKAHINQTASPEEIAQALKVLNEAIYEG